MVKRYDEQTEKEMKKFYNSLDERQKRLYAAQEAFKLGRGGNKYMSELLSISPKTIYNGQKELKENNDTIDIVNARKRGGGRKKMIETIKELKTNFNKVLEKYKCGSPMQPNLIWIDVSLKKFAEEITALGTKCSPYLAKQMLKELNLGVRKMQRKLSHKTVGNSNEQYENMQQLIKDYTEKGNPIISSDVKKKKR